MSEYWSSGAMQMIRMDSKVKVWGALTIFFCSLNQVHFFPWICTACMEFSHTILGNSTTALRICQQVLCEHSWAFPSSILPLNLNTAKMLENLRFSNPDSNLLSLGLVYRSRDICFPLGEMFSTWTLLLQQDNIVSDSGHLILLVLALTPPAPLFSSSQTLWCARNASPSPPPYGAMEGPLSFFISVCVVI